MHPEFGGRVKTFNRVLTSLLFMLISGCGTLPDARPFADATGTLSASVKSTGQALADSMHDASALDPANKQQYDDLIKRLDDAWAIRVRAAQGAVTYSDAIADLIGAGKESGETVKKVGDSLETLAAAVNIPLSAPAVGVAGDIARFLVDRIAILRASKKLEEAVAQAQPAIDRIADHLASETENQLRPALKDAYKNTISSLKSQYEKDDNFATSFSKKREEALQALLMETNAANMQKLQEYDHIQASVATRLHLRDQSMEQATAAYKARLQLMNALSAATRAWAQAHRDLASAIKEKRKVNAAELQETITDLKVLIKRVSAL